MAVHQRAHLCKVMDGCNTGGVSVTRPLLAPQPGVGKRVAPPSDQQSLIKHRRPTILHLRLRRMLDHPRRRRHREDTMLLSVRESAKIDDFTCSAKSTNTKRPPSPSNNCRLGHPAEVHWPARAGCAVSFFKAVAISIMALLPCATRLPFAWPPRRPPQDAM